MTVEEENQKTINRLSKDIGNDIIKEMGKILDEPRPSRVLPTTYLEQLKKSFTYDDQRKLVGSTAIHARVTEFGFPKGKWIPVERLKVWAEKKLNTDRNAVVYAIKKKIHDEGIPPVFYMFRAIQRIASKG